MRSLPFLLLAGLALLFLVPGTMSDEGPGPQMGLAGNPDYEFDAQDVAVVGGYAYIAAGYEGVVVVDVSDPANPTYVESYDAYAGSGYAHDVTVSGGYAYIADGSNGLVVMDVSDPSNLTYVDDYPTNFAYDVTVSGGYAYIASGYNGLVVVDVSDPSNLTYAVGLSTGSDALGVVVSDGYAYVCSGNGLLVVVDVSDPTNPTYAGEFNVVADSSDVAVWLSGYAYVAAGPNGLVVVDVSDPANPTYAGGYDQNPGYANGVAVSGGYAYIADSYGLVVIDVSDPTNPDPVGGYDGAGYDGASYARGVTVSGGYAYVTIDGPSSAYGGLLVLGLDSDGDTIADVADSFPSNPNEWNDIDGDGVGDNSDAFPNNLAASLDSDGDGFPDEWNSGITSLDIDDDGYPDSWHTQTLATLYLDRFPFIPTEWRDTDDDGVGDNSDVFPLDSDEQFDTDRDGTGDNSDVFPHDSDEQFDTDGDGVGDNSDSFPRISFFKSWWGPILLTFITITGSSFLWISRTNKGILAEAEQILEEFESKEGDIAPAWRLIDEARNFNWEFGNFYFGVWDLVGKPRAEEARDKAEEISSERSQIQEEIDVVDKMLKGFDKDGVDVSLSMTKMKLGQTALSKGKFAEAWERLASARSIGSRLKEDYVESMKRIDQVKAKITEFKEKGVNTDELEKILEKAEKSTKKN